MKPIKFYEDLDKVYKELNGDGAFLVAQDKDGKVNVMTIGWATIGYVWTKPMMTVYVRPTRYTYEILENAKTFSVCVPSAGKLKQELIFCGTNSGRMLDKVKQCHFTMIKGKLKDTQLIEGCKHYYECEIVEKNKVLPETLSKDIIDNLYPKRDFHTVYYGEIKHALVRE